MQLTRGTNKPAQLLRHVMLAVTLLGLSGVAQAKDYLVEVIVFEHRDKKESVMPGNLFYPKLVR